MSHKDRIAKAMLQEAEARGDLTGPDGEMGGGCRLVLLESSLETLFFLAIHQSLLRRPQSLTVNAVLLHPFHFYSHDDDGGDGGDDDDDAR